MKIEVLPPDVAAKIAAGEVVERPASAVKELVENAIDADATDIQVEIRDGGKRLIRVRDNGSGIPASQAALAFARHSTSKLRTIEDLDHLTTLGFRGEALASIAAVSQLTMVTCVQEGADSRGPAVGTLLRLEGGQIIHQESHGCPPGTLVTVENLFYNTPARRKFLRSEATETSLIADLVTNYALAYPEIRFALHSNGRLVLQTAGTGKLLDVLVKVYGPDIAQGMISFQEETERRSIDGYLSPPTLHRADRKGLIFFVNRRGVQDRLLSQAVLEAYHDLLPARRYPLAILNIRIEPSEVDVNIHPTKREIRFREAHQVFSTVQRAVRHALQERAPLAGLRTVPTTVSGAMWGPQPAAASGASPGAGQIGLELQRTADRQGLGPASFQPWPSRLPMLRVIGQVAQTYIIAEGPGGMYLIDQHAAHERVIYERMMAERQAAQLTVQALLDPLVIELTPSQAQVLEAHLDEMRALGLDIVPFGLNTYRVQAVPTSLVNGDITGAIAEMLDQAGSGGRPWEEEALIALVCHSAVRAGKPLSLPEMRDLIQQLEGTSAPHSCPHGRPTMIHLSAAQLEREFRRR